MRRLTTAFLILLLPLASASSQTVKSGTRGIFLNLSLGGSSLTFSEDFDEDTHSGPGGTFMLGYGFNSKFAILLDASGATLEDDADEDWTFSQGDLAARFSFANPARSLVPYLQAGFSYRSLRNEAAGVDEDDIEVSGGGFSIGGGLHYYFSPKWALTGSVTFSGGEFSEVRVNNLTISGLEVDATSTRFGIGVSWFPRS